MGKDRKALYRRTRKRVVWSIIYMNLKCISDALDKELCEWMRKEGYSNDFAQMKKQDILECIDKTLQAQGCVKWKGKDD